MAENRIGAYRKFFSGMNERFNCFAGACLLLLGTGCATRTPTEQRTAPAAFIESMRLHSFQVATNQDTAEAYGAFLEVYPSGLFAEEARLLLEAFSLKAAFEKNTIDAYRNFLRDFPHSQFSDDAQQLLETASFEKAQALDTRYAYGEFLVRFPNGRHREEARRRSALCTEQVKRLTEAAKQALSARAQVEIEDVSGPDEIPRYAITAHLLSGHSPDDPDPLVRGPYRSRESLATFVRDCCLRVLRSISRAGNLPKAEQIKISIRHGVRQRDGGRDSPQTIYEITIPLSVIQSDGFSSWTNDEITKRWTVLHNAIPKLEIIERP